MSLEEDITTKAREIQTDGYSMSIGEMLSMYRDGDLEVHPEFQRIFRWEDEQKWRLIESILLGIPIPTIFVAQRDDGIWDVIDGVQRLSTILEFVGEYRDEEGTTHPPLALGPTEYLPSLGGYIWDGAGEDEKPLGEVLRRDFKRSKLDFRIIKKESDNDAKFDLFQRLNSGTQLSPQESRNCLLVMLNPDFYRWMNELAAKPALETTAQLTERKEDEGFRQELVLRFFIQQEYAGGATDLALPIGDYITKWVRGAANSTPEQLERRETDFDRAFAVISSALSEDAFRRWNSISQKFMGPFSISGYEAVVSGVSHNIDHWEAATGDEFVELVKAMWDDPEFRKNSGTGITARRRLPRLIEFGRKYFFR